jgi:luciferase family oxidoreductase group 1
MFELSILDQSPIISGQTPAAAIRASIELAQAADRLGYHRYWLAEHHAMTGLADPCPEILLGQLGAHTRRIRIGTGGVLLPYYSPLKVAEVFRMYEALFPGRVDLGIGRAPGGNLMTARAMNAEAFLADDRFPTQVQELVGYLDDSLPPEYPYHMVKAMPSGPTSPQVWLLGSSDYSAALAAYLGLRFAFAHFINAQVGGSAGGDTVMRAYRQDFRASYRERRPCAMLTVFVICAPTHSEAEALAASIDLRRYQMSQGIEAPIATPQEAQAYVYSVQARAIVERERARAVIGAPDAVKARLLALKEQFGADELMVITITGDYATRLRSYELLAEAFDLGSAAQAAGIEDLQLTGSAQGAES